MFGDEQPMGARKGHAWATRAKLTGNFTLTCFIPGVPKLLDGLGALDQPAQSQQVS